MIKHILYPTDGSEASQAALKDLQAIAQSFQAKITLLHCYEFTMGHVLYRYGTDSAYVQEVEKRFENYGHETLHALANELRDSGFQIEKELVMKGSAGPLILKTAHEEGCDLILMGTRGLGGFRSVFLGSTSHYVANHSKDIPVYLVPVPESGQTAN
ncbi:hypothetical protein COW36_00405 [bacterium (Candidatus Blackallbacteria) CG17_big_fil_post_rev_8_21_14_2_50_48_46]|uniref:UspA domain-containing protein n=1 Tax=bacterium (Candidatus Blackallbacteria) CG17_big_fil_post_rev_8_21_14_2_50_48_46 TaxID=2014261 RepID=A0A2M7GAX3_9BACT|nr:MAG: hypothetical protein COW64_10765 [bacterium (Candidatus Blackallbacteria) CG18_big_fil_WC_8_21_14_2_50_49_26]PIW19334.1 MAG: hypothetical protein COW36_00405 [bacterium (Candidatus Blackallbacteria) CG17_big_fil_post_rev_8_21_14_2_50_48_46]PIW49062.1 MAG: hypothetical protein COW20_08050 [bacterium (Candidatus Blackallbacteria) CG13_big_fil_rev_8_21_14_2_50_49_14]